MGSAWVGDDLCAATWAVEAQWAPTNRLLPPGPGMVGPGQDT